MSLIEAMIALAILSIIIFVMLYFWDYFFDTRRLFNIHDEVNNLKHELLTNVDCDRTVFEGRRVVEACRWNSEKCPDGEPAGRWMTVYKKRPFRSTTPHKKIVSTANTSSFEGNLPGGYHYIQARARCACCEGCTFKKQVLIEYKAKKWEPLFGEDLKTWQPLFGGVPFFCPIGRG